MTKENMNTRRLFTVAQVVMKGLSGNPKYLLFQGDHNFKRRVMEKETVSESIDLTFEQFGLDTRDIPKTPIKIEDDGETLTLYFLLSVDYLSLLNFLVGEGKDTGLELAEEE